MQIKPNKSITTNIILSLLIILIPANAGNLFPSSGPADTMKTLEDIYCRYADCQPGNYSINSPGIPSETMRGLSEISAQIDTEQYGRGWTANPSGAGSTALTRQNCESASSSGWWWFEDGNGDGDQNDPEDGLCVFASTTMALSWNGYDWSTNSENSYIAAYTCAGNFPAGYVASYSGISSTGAADNVWNNGDCALCQADCYDGKKDLPDQGSWTTGNTAQVGGVQGPLTPEVLKKWKGTRLPTFNDFYGYCGYKDGGSNYETGCSVDMTHGSYGQMVGRTDECIDLSNSANYEWLSEQVFYNIARVAGGSARVGRREDCASAHDVAPTSGRSEERRVGKECRSRWSPYH